MRCGKGIAGIHGAGGRGVCRGVAGVPARGGDGGVKLAQRTAGGFGAQILVISPRGT